jgi:hypothetical protein
MPETDAGGISLDADAQLCTEPSGRLFKCHRINNTNKLNWKTGIIFE